MARSAFSSERADTLPAQAGGSLWMLSLILAVALGLAIVFRLMPHLDLQFTGLFYDPDGRFFLEDIWPVRFSYAVFRDIHLLLLPLLLWLLFASWFWAGASERMTRRRLAFLLLVLLLGPGLLVNEILKNHVGRARPSQVVEFAGNKTFTPAFAPAEQCRRNCSFVSGHASMGFYFIAFAWVLGKRRWIFYGLAIGSVAGLGRIVQGGHFLSDVIFSGVAVLLTCLLVSRWLFGRWFDESP